MLGDRLGNWIVYKELGRGGMGRVYLGREELTGRQVALKILAAELAQDVGFLQRFQREIAALQKLDHPNIVHFYESGYENGFYYYAMEYVEGENLEDILAKRQRLPYDEVLDIARQVCAALKHAHDHGVIHRDLKPPNLLMTADGVVKLSDFGIAKVFAADNLTATGGVLGTAEFMSPEQATGKPVTKRSDLYSLGVVLYALLVGRPPFQGKTNLEVMHKHRYAQFDRPQSFVPELPYEVDELVCQLLAKDPAERPPDALVLGRQIDGLRRKLERKTHLTEVGPVQSETVIEPRPGDVPREAHVGPATLMSKLMRAELEREKYGGPWQRFFNRGWVLGPLFLLCVGIIVWTFWPLGPDALFERGAALMASKRLADQERAWSEYLLPLSERYPDNPYRDEVEKLRRQLEATRRADQGIPAGEGQRFFEEGERLLKEGRAAQARQVWTNLVTAFDGVAAEKTWVARARGKLAELADRPPDKERLGSVREALDHAERVAVRDRPQALRILDALEQLYQQEPALLDEVRRFRDKLKLK
jgi:serine/threonine-protein kinase